MKKLSVLFAMLLCVSVIFAQEKKEKKDYSDLFPKKGTVSVGLDAVQIVRFLGAQTFGRINGNMANGNNAVGAFQDDFFVKYFISDNIALRFRLGLNINTSTDKQWVTDDSRVTDPNYDLIHDRLVDTRRVNNGLFNLGVGAEWRKSFWRMQGYLGGEVFIGAGYNTAGYKYANAITQANQHPSNGFSFGTTRTKSASQSQLIYGAGVFAGVDYFFNKSVSLGLEFGLNGNAFYYAPNKTTTESWKDNDIFIEKTKANPAESEFNLVPRIGLNLSIYF
ncbi:MAG: hypothetical protein LBC89_05150 [Bacteroidales bacterium]|jgi:hypothetical protein|nr:hypothetical protein [Bacteroidales bacterium]